MKVKVENEKIFAYMAVMDLDEFSMARKCEISLNQARNLLKRKVWSTNGKVLIRFCNNTNLKFSSIFQILESKTASDKLTESVLLNYYDGDDRLKL